MRTYLKELRTQCQVSQAQIAQKLDISESYYNLIEKGNRQSNMNLPTMNKLATAFGVPLEQILQEEMKLQSSKQ